MPHWKSIGGNLIDYNIWLAQEKAKAENEVKKVESKPEVNKIVKKVVKKKKK